MKRLPKTWASVYIDELRKGNTVSFRPTGNSMEPRIKSGELCTVVPILLRDLEIGDVVLCTVNGADYLHKVLRFSWDMGTVEIGNNHGGVNGLASAVYGKLVKVEA